MKNLIYIALLLSPIITLSQVGINTTTVDPSAALQLQSSNKALLLPRVELTSKADIATIQNPAVGLIVLNIKTSDPAVSDTDKVYENIMYLFNGVRWQTIMTDDTPISTLNLPKIYARGRKSATENIGCNIRNGSNQLNGADFDLTSLDNLTNKGVIKANKAGYYKFSIKATLYFRPSTSQTPVLAYALPNISNSLTFTFRGNTTTAIHTEYSVTYSGVVYLNQGEQSGYFTFSLGGSGTCKTTAPSDEIREEEVIWVYLGK